CDSYTLPALAHGNYYRQPGGPNSGEGNLMQAGDVITNTQTIYVYRESGERINCIDENSFTVTINNTPIIPPMANVNAVNAYVLPVLTVGHYYTGPNKTGVQLNAGDSIPSDQTIYVYAETGTNPNCSAERSFSTTVFNVDELADITTCDRFILPALNIGKYYTGPLGTGTNLPAGHTITSSQTIYIYELAPFDSISYDESSFEVNIVDAPTANAVPANLLTACDTDGDNDGVFNFNLSALNPSILGNQTGAEFVVTYYSNFDDAMAAANSITTTNLTTVFVRVSNTLTANCYDIKTFQIRINKLPEPRPQGGTMCYDSANNVLLNPYTISSGLSASQYTFQWVNEEGTIVGTGTNYQAILPGVYSVIATDIITGCPSEPTPATVVSSEPAIVTYTVSENFDDNQTIVVEATGVGGDYEYQLDYGPFQDSPTFYNVSSG
ncbi:MAG: adhesin, partial [Bacteroidota bacterium]